MRPARRARIVATAALAGLVASGCAPGAGPSNGDLRRRWGAALERLGVDPEPLVAVTITWTSAAADEPGVAADGLRLPAAWRDRPDDPAVVGRVAHLVHHLGRGLPERHDAGSCAAWELLLVAAELEGWAVEARVRAALGAPLQPDAPALALRARIDQYHARCE